MGTLEPISEGVQVGVDIGQRQDPSAIVVVELQRRDYTRNRRGRVEGGEIHYMARHVERLPLGTPYPVVVNRLAEINEKLIEQEQYPRFWCDATGVGQPVVELLDAAELSVTPVYLTGSDRAVEEGRELRLGKALMVSRLQVLLQCERIHLPQTAEAKALIDELLNYEIRVTDNAHAQFGAFRTGQHDDLATALGLACWAEGFFFDIAFI